MSEFIDRWVDIVKKQGDRYEMDTSTCVLWKMEHQNCFGCPSEIGCSKTVRLALVNSMPLVYTPSSFADFQSMHTRVQELTDKLLAAKSLDELKAVPTA